MVDSIGSIVGELLGTCDAKRRIGLVAKVLRREKIGLQFSRDLARELEWFVDVGDFLSVRTGQSDAAFTPVA